MNQSELVELVNIKNSGDDDGESLKKNFLTTQETQRNYLDILLNGEGFPKESQIVVIALLKNLDGVNELIKSLTADDKKKLKQLLMTQFGWVNIYSNYGGLRRIFDKADCQELLENAVSQLKQS